MTTIKIWQLFYVYFLFEECETRRVYTSRTFQTVSGGGSIQNRNPNLSTAMSNIGNVPLNNFFSNENGKLTIPKQILANLPPGASVSISTKINIGQPGRSVSTIQTRDPAGKTITRQNIQNVPNHTNFSNGRRWKTYRKTWSKSIPVSSIPKSNNRRSNLPNIWTSNLQNVSMSNIFTGIPNQTFIPKEWLANLPPGAHVKFSSSSSVIPQGAHVNFRQSSSVIPHGAHVNFRSSSRVIPHGAHVKFSSSSSVIPQGLSTVHSNQQGRVRKITRIISTYNDHQSVQDNQRRRNRHLPQPLPSLQPGVYCGDTLCEEEKFLMLEEHNRVRRSTNPQAADMKKIIWDIELEKSAQSYAKMCIWAHDKSRSQQNLPYRYVGQNMNARRGSRNILSATSRWEREQNNYNIYTGTCIPGKLCGHYTQMVWAETETVGCGMWKCPYIHQLGWRDAYIIVCNYGPGGNIGGEKPYKIGNKCSECHTNNPSCVDGLCI